MRRAAVRAGGLDRGGARTRCPAPSRREPPAGLRRRAPWEKKRPGGSNHGAALAVDRARQTVRGVGAHLSAGREDVDPALRLHEFVLEQRRVDLGAGPAAISIRFPWGSRTNICIFPPSSARTRPQGSVSMAPAPARAKTLEVGDLEAEAAAVRARVRQHVHVDLLAVVDAEELRGHALLGRRVEASSSTSR